MKSLLIALIALVLVSFVHVELKPPSVNVGSPVKAVHAKKQSEAVKAPAPAVEAVKQAPVQPVAVPEKAVAKTIANPSTNEAIVWNYLVDQKFTREQTAGIMGNLWQEHKFSTTDTPSGLGIAQWIAGRRARLIARGNHLDLRVQLDYLMHELNTTEIKAHRAVRSAVSVEAATIAFQNLFERCGDCRQSQRISYSLNVLSRY